MKGNFVNYQTTADCLRMSLIFLLIVFLPACGDRPDTENDSAGSTYRIQGINFSPYTEGQDPNVGAQASEEQIRVKMKRITPYTHWIRTYGSTQGLEKAGPIARSLGLRTALGAWIDSDPVTNEREIQNLTAAAKAGEADMAIVGSEVLLRKDLPEKELIAYIQRVRQAAPGIPVAYADNYSILLSHPSIVDAVDVVLVNYYPCLEGISVEQAVAAVHSWHQQILSTAAGKKVIVSETGWPSNGKAIGPAVFSPNNAAFYFMNFVSWARANHVDYFYFEAFDETWKAGHEESQGAHWGVIDESGMAKPGMAAVFRGDTMADNWSRIEIPGGHGNPTVAFTSVPPIGGSGDLKGRVRHVHPFHYKIAVYVYVSGWWTKPGRNKPLTTVFMDGTWTCDITTGGMDETATKIVAYLLPNGVDPPVVEGDAALPIEIEHCSIAKVETIRGSFFDRRDSKTK